MKLKSATEAVADNLVKAIKDVFEMGGFAVDADTGFYLDRLRVKVQMPCRAFNKLFHERVIVKPWDDKHYPQYPYIKETRVNGVLFFCILDAAQAEAEGLTKKKEANDEDQRGSEKAL